MPLLRGASLAEGGCKPGDSVLGNGGCCPPGHPVSGNYCCPIGAPISGGSPPCEDGYMPGGASGGSRDEDDNNGGGGGNEGPYGQGHPTPHGQGRGTPYHHDGGYHHHDGGSSGGGGDGYDPTCKHNCKCESYAQTEIEGLVFDNKKPCLMTECVKDCVCESSHCEMPACRSNCNCASYSLEGDEVALYQKICTMPKCRSQCERGDDDDEVVAVE